MQAGPQRMWRVGNVAWGALAALALLAGAAHAKPWAEWAPGPLASDSDFVAFQGMPADSLDVNQLAWLDVQRDWRVQREREQGNRRSSSLTESVSPHHARDNDGRFASLASRRYAKLDSREVSWLVTENAAQRVESGPSTASTAVGFALLGVVVGAAVGAGLLVYVLSHSPWFTIF